MNRNKNFYTNSLRRKKWAESMCRTNKSGIITKNRENKTIEQLKNIKYTSLILLNNLRIKSLKDITKDLKIYDISFPTIAIRILLKNIDFDIIKQINKQRKNKKISIAISKKMKTNLEYRLKCVKSLTSRNGQKYHSKGELRLKGWLRNNFPKYDWKFKHIAWNNEIFEFDIYSKKYDDFYIEYNGIIHYKNLYKSQKFHDIQRKDKLKIHIMKELNKKFIVIKDSIDFKEQIEIVKKLIGGGEGTFNPSFS